MDISSCASVIPGLDVVSYENTEELNVLLEIEGKTILCNKEELAEHSDYFKAMFSGNFAESYESVIKLNLDVRFLPFSIIVQILRNPNLDSVDEDLYLSILETCVVLQFNGVKEMLLLRHKISVTAENCIKLWQSFKKIGLKSLALEYKRYGLLHFEKVKNTKQILVLNLKQLHNYLADKRLCCEREYNVFQVCMDWWHAYVEKERPCALFREQAFLSFLCCLDFTSLSICDICEIIQCVEVSGNDTIVTILKCVIELKKGTCTHSEDMQLYTWARKLFNSESRKSNMLFCMLLSSEYRKSTHSSYCGTELQPSVISDNVSREVDFVYYDQSKRDFVTFFSVCNFKWSGLFGFKVVSHLEKIYILGGQYGIRTGNFNKELWVYDCFLKNWTQKSSMPFMRRHSLVIVGGNSIFIVGGIGNYGIIQHSMFWYSIVDDKWSSLIELPFSETPKGGYCNNQLVLLDSGFECLYIFNHIKNTWKTIKIILPSSIPTPLIGSYEILTYKNYIYVKGQYLIKMVLLNEMDVEVDVVNTKKLDNPKAVVTSACILGSVIYTIYQSVFEHDTDFIVEEYCTESHVSKMMSIGNQVFEFCANGFVLQDILSNKKNVVNKFDF